MSEAQIYKLGLLLLALGGPGLLMCLSLAAVKVASSIRIWWHEASAIIEYDSERYSVKVGIHRKRETRGIDADSIISTHRK